MEQNLFSNINGLLVLTTETNINSQNDMVRSRYGLYETMLFRNGLIELAELHWERLWIGLKVLGFTLPETYCASFFQHQIEVLAAQNRATISGRIRLQIYAKNDTKPYQPFYFIEVIPIDYNLTQWNEKGLELGFLNDFSKPMVSESNCKISHSKHIPLAKIAIAEHRWDDVLLTNTVGRVIESAIANLFWVKDNVIYTVPLSEGCLAGTMRYWIIVQLKSKGCLLVEKVLSKDELLAADEVFLTNGIRKIKWVKKIGDKQYEPHKTKVLYQKMIQ